MISLMLPELSADAGPASDGVVRGRVNQSLFTRVVSNVQLANAIYAIRKDISGSSFAFSDVSALAVGTVSNGLEPWGGNAAMSAGDELYVACDNLVREMYFDIDTPGVWTGNMEIAYSSDGITANKTAQGLSDGTNGFRNADGIYRVAFTAPTDIVSFSPVPGLVTSRKWLVVRPANVGTVTTSPKLKRLWLLHGDGDVTYGDFSTHANAALTSNDFSALPSTIFPSVGGELVFVLPFLGYGVDFVVHQKMANVQTRTHEYLASGGAWKSLPNFSDASNDFTSGPASTSEASQTFAVRWTIPDDWTEKTVTFAGVGSITGYLVRWRTTAVSTYGPTPTPWFRARCRAFGASNAAGLRFHSAQTLRGAMLAHIGVGNATMSVLNLVNANTGRGTPLSVPANSIAPLHVDLSPALAIAAGEGLIVAHQSGGALQDVELILQD